jgi:hypothetical protein
MVRPVVHNMLEMIVDNPDERLIVYGSLAPGGVNSFLLRPLGGTWQKCLIRGRMERYRGFKRFQYDPEGEEYQAWLFSSAALPPKLAELDDFEGDEYQRILIPAQIGEHTVMAHIYAGRQVD